MRDYINVLHDVILSEDYRNVSVAARNAYVSMGFFTDDGGQFHRPDEEPYYGYFEESLMDELANAGFIIKIGDETFMTDFFDAYDATPDSGELLGKTKAWQEGKIGFAGEYLGSPFIVIEK